MGWTAADGFVDGSGVSHVGTSAGIPFSAAKDPVCYDLRRLRALGHRGFAWDVKLLLGSTGDLVPEAKARSVACWPELFRRKSTYDACTRAISGSRVDTRNVPLSSYIPHDVLRKYLQARTHAILQLFELVPARSIQEYRREVYPLVQTLSKIESNGINVDAEFARTVLKGEHTAVEGNFFRSLVGLQHGGVVMTRISPVGSKTKRLRTEAGFNAMAIPHGRPRQAIVSRFESGRILAVDFNAIDYRCIVEACGDEALHSFYRGQKDFHTRTASVFGEVTPTLRSIVKQATYVHIYGGSLETIVKTTGESMENIRKMVERLDELFSPVAAFRDRISRMALSQGWIDTPNGYRVPVPSDSHPGKVVGLYAQTYSSSVFNQALRSVVSFLEGKKTLPIFTVHDELVFDCHPDEPDAGREISTYVEEETGYAVKWKQGATYADATAD